MTDALLILTLFVALGIAALSRRWCLAVTAFCLPLTRWLPETSIAGLNPTNLLLLAVLAHTALTKRNPGFKERRDPVLIPALIIMLFYVISVIRVQISDDLPLAFVHSGGRLANLLYFKTILSMFVLYYCSRRMIRDSDTLRRAVIGVMGGFSLQALLSGMAFLTGGYQDARAEGLLGESNEFGLFLATYVMLPVAAIMDRTRRLFMVAVPMVAVTLAGILGTLSRGALLSGGGAAAVMALARRGLLIVLIGSVIASAPFWLPESVLERFGETKARDRWGLSGVPGFESGTNLDLNREARFHIWSAGVRMAVDKPLFGIGLGLFPYRLGEYGSPRVGLGPHNEYLSLAAQCGIAASLAHLAMLLGLGRVALRLALQRDDKLSSTFGLGLLGMVISLLIGGMFLVAFYSTSFSGPFLILAAIGVNLYSKQTGQSDA